MIACQKLSSNRGKMPTTYKIRLYVIFKMQIGKEASYLDLPTLRLCLVSFFHNVAYIIELECTYTTSIRVKIHNHKRDLKHNICIYWFPYWEWF